MFSPLLLFVCYFTIRELSYFLCTMLSTFFLSYWLVYLHLTHAGIILYCLCCDFWVDKHIIGPFHSFWRLYWKILLQMYMQWIPSSIYTLSYSDSKDSLFCSSSYLFLFSSTNFTFHTGILLYGIHCLSKSGEFLSISISTLFIDFLA